MPALDKYTEDIITGLLLDKYSDPQWACYPQMRTSVGFSYAGAPVRTMDFFAVNTWESQFVAIAFEIKCARSDFLQELKAPEKRLDALGVSHQFFFVTAPGVAKLWEIPDECGWIEVNGSGSLSTRKRAPKRSKEKFPDEFIAMLLRQSKIEYNFGGLFKYAGKPITEKEIDALVSSRHRHLIDWEARRKITEIDADIERRKRDIENRESTCNGVIEFLNEHNGGVAMDRYSIRRWAESHVNSVKHLEEALGLAGRQISEILNAMRSGKQNAQ